jgi:hypothetical protein
LNQIRLGRARLFGVIAVLSMAFLGVVYPVLTATTVVETVTETIAQPGRTITTVTVLEGGDRHPLRLQAREVLRTRI